MVKSEGFVRSEGGRGGRPPPSPRPPLFSLFSFPPSSSRLPPHSLLLRRFPLSYCEPSSRPTPEAALRGSREGRRAAGAAAPRRRAARRSEEHTSELQSRLH